ncbi:hypothetical protein SKAU_G00390690 [Synaphobranchus kaupii]|uniref:Uncharacterized protein n=1 Tax=Synaphobranchus kaupii TaxID=118154 RepID=A0A9Q1EBH3_SYNKA|nr:hypothetical protein SKAU_G00390690 [Synaphobranchus kaupii]
MKDNNIIGARCCKRRHRKKTCDLDMDMKCPVGDDERICKTGSAKRPPRGLMGQERGVAVSRERVDSAPIHGTPAPLALRHRSSSSVSPAQEGPRPSARHGTVKAATLHRHASSAAAALTPRAAVRRAVFICIRTAYRPAAAVEGVSQWSSFCAPLPRACPESERILGRRLTKVRSENVGSGSRSENRD